MKVSGIPETIIWWLGAESNHRHEDLQSTALPTELPSHITFNCGGYLSISAKSGIIAANVIIANRIPLKLHLQDC